MSYDEVEERNYSRDRRVRARDEYDERWERFDESSMTIELSVPECEEACCAPPYSSHDLRQSLGRAYLQVFDGDRYQGLGPLGYGLRESVDRLGDEFNGNWAPAIHPKTVTVGARFEVCETCEGRGKHVDPSVDSSGLTSEDFEQDPDFRETYFAGGYDVECYGCRGKRVVPVADD